MTQRQTYHFPGVLRLVVLVAAILSAVTPAASEETGERVLLRIRAGNKDLAKTWPVRIFSELPQRIRSRHVISTGGLDLRYDVRKDVYYVEGTVTLAPRETTVIDVELENIWIVPERTLEDMDAQAQRMTRLLDGTASAGEAKALQDSVADAIRRIRALQNENSIARGTPVLDLIKAFEECDRILAQAARDVGVLEHMVLGTGQDPGGLVGEIRRLTPERPDLQMRPEEFRTVGMRVSIENTSPVERRVLNMHRELPREIGIEDVLDAGGLSIGRNPGEGITYLYRNDIELGPGERQVFEIVLRDKWNVNGWRIPRLRTLAEDLLFRVQSQRKYVSVEAEIEKVLNELDELEKEVGPETVGPDYVSFYRAQGLRLDDAENRIARIEQALRAIEIRQDRGFVKPERPDVKTTWLIIYIILGFLALISLLFFIRWFGRGSDETAQAGGGIEDMAKKSDVAAGGERE